MLATLAQLKTHLRIASDDTAQDNLLTHVLTTAGVQIERWLDRVLTYSATARTEVHVGGRYDVWCKAWPIILKTSVKERQTDGTWGAALVENTDFYAVASRGQIVRLPEGARWAAGSGAVQLVYTGGYTTEGTVVSGVEALPERFVRAALLQAAHLYQRSLELGAGSATLTGPGGGAAWSEQYQLLASVKHLLAGERRFVG